ncbi:exosome protein [Desulfurococcaceae archaeon MEX13E-LK6-19]|nr:exosome protein [Desulfurococcaceae archaeon MEX13E-LK6-19]
MLRIHRIELSVYCHATEDLDKVVSSLLNLIPETIRERVKITKQSVKGYYGNIITIIKAVVSGNDAIETMKYIASKISDVEKSILRASLKARYDPRSNKIFFRFDKQELYRGRIVVSDSDDIVHVALSFKGKGGIDDVEKLLSEIGLI